MAPCVGIEQHRVASKSNFYAVRALSGNGARIKQVASINENGRLTPPDYELLDRLYIAAVV
jgi:hypothetical protein